MALLSIEDKGFHKIAKHLQFLLVERLDSLLKTYDELQLMVLDEVSLIGSRFIFYQPLS